MSNPEIAWSMAYAGAVSGRDTDGLAVDAPVAAHLGDPYGEQRRWVSGHALIDHGHHAVLRVEGAQRLAWLDGLLSQAVGQLPPGQAVQALILSPQGHVEHHLRVVDDGQASWLLAEAGDGQPTVDFLRSMVFRSGVSVQECSSQFAVVTVMPASPLLQRLRELHPEVTVLELAHEAPGEPPARWCDVVVPRSVLAMPEVFSADQVAGLWAWQAWRVEHGVPRLGVDTDHRSIPHELGWVGSAVTLGKGCYRGQETVARVHNLGRPPRRLVRLHLDGSAERLPTPGAAVFTDEGDQVGYVGTAVRHYELGPLALAVVKRNTDPQASLTVEGIAATQEQIVPADTSPAVEIPRLGSLASRGLTGLKRVQ